MAFFKMTFGSLNPTCPARAVRSLRCDFRVSAAFCAAWTVGTNAAIPHQLTRRNVTRFLACAVDWTMNWGVCESPPRRVGGVITIERRHKRGDVHQMNFLTLRGSAGVGLHTPRGCGRLALVARLLLALKRPPTPPSEGQFTE